MGYIIDVSKHQGIIEWDKVKPLVDFVIIKASGKTKDPYYNQNVYECERLKIPYHAYHFLYCTNELQAKIEAKLFNDSVGQTQPLSYVLDCEGAWGIANKDARRIAEVFESELRRLRGQDIKVAVYIGHNVYKSYKLDYDHYAYVWIPRYKKIDDGKPNGKKPSYKTDLWQYTSKGKIAGVNGNVDMDKIISNKPLSFFTTPNGPEFKQVELVIVPTPKTLGTRALKKGSKGEDVKELQSGLIKMGYNLGKYGADGDFGAKTYAAVRAFQKKYGLTVDGIFGAKSFKKYVEVMKIGF